MNQPQSASSRGDETTEAANELFGALRHVTRKVQESRRHAMKPAAPRGGRSGNAELQQMVARLTNAEKSLAAALARAAHAEANAERFPNYAKEAQAKAEAAARREQAEQQRQAAQGQQTSGPGIDWATIGVVAAGIAVSQQIRLDAEAEQAEQQLVGQAADTTHETDAGAEAAPADLEAAPSQPPAQTDLPADAPLEESQVTADMSLVDISYAYSLSEQLASVLDGQDYTAEVPLQVPDLGAEVDAGAEV